LYQKSMYTKMFIVEQLFDVDVRCLMLASIKADRRLPHWWCTVMLVVVRSLLFIVVQFTKTIICQSHLCPLPLHVAPVYWTYDFALRMYPLPDLIVCADKYDPFTSTQVECTVTNPVCGLNYSVPSFLTYFIFRALVLLIEWQEGHPSCKKPAAEVQTDCPLETQPFLD